MADSDKSGPYLTPNQQKDKQIKELKKQVKILEKTIAEKDAELHEMKDRENTMIDETKKKESEVAGLNAKYDIAAKDLEEGRQRIKDLEQIVSEKDTAMEELQTKINELKVEFDNQEKVHQRRYLELYQKGKEAILIEQEEELVRNIAMDKKDPSTQKLVDKLFKTEKKLEKLQLMKRDEIYKGFPVNVSDDHARLGMLRSAFFYFLTGCEEEGNLEMIIELLEFNEGQKSKIEESMKNNKKMKKTKKK